MPTELATPRQYIHGKRRVARVYQADVRVNALSIESLLVKTDSGFFSDKLCGACEESPVTEYLIKVKLISVK